MTGQYSRFGALLDPVVDRLLVISGVVVCWRFELLPRWALAVLVARELFMLVAGRAALRRGVVLQINWWGRWSVWPLMSALFFGLCGLTTFAAVLLYLGLFLSLTATVFYVRDATGAGQGRWRATLKLPLSVGPALVRIPRTMDTFPDLGSLSDEELKEHIQQLTEEETEISYRRRILHGKIDILRAELVNRLRKKHEGGEEVISGADVQRLTDILAGRAGGDEG